VNNQKINIEDDEEASGLPEKWKGSSKIHKPSFDIEPSEDYLKAVAYIDKEGMSSHLNMKE